ncbi:hypothetical protein ACFWCA_19180 [Streptomyces phaeochromogenes]|uniref:hypothetical protein n=1 Tax=Streptomyces phaeochromogenes TaxID=1923 RepID=UPI0036CBC8EB
MLKPATSDELAAVATILGAGHQASPELVLDAAKIHDRRRRGVLDAHAFGRYCDTALPWILLRLLAAESDLATLRAKVAEHVAAADLGRDPTPRELLDDCRRAGINLQADAADAAALLEAQAHAHAIG